MYFICQVSEDWYGKSRPVLQFIKEHNGAVIFMGGGDILKDEIKMAYNLGVDFHLMKGPAGASNEAAIALPSHAFTGSRGLVSVLTQKRAALLKSSPNSQVSSSLVHFPSHGVSLNKCSEFFRK